VCLYIDRLVRIAYTVSVYGILPSSFTFYTAAAIFILYNNVCKHNDNKNQHGFKWLSR